MSNPQATHSSDADVTRSRTIDRPPILAVEDLRRSFGGVRAVDGATFAIQRGEITGLIGPNGAGKSTALNVISGLIAPDGGKVMLEGEEIGGQPPHKVVRKGVVRTFQHPSEFGQLTVMENLLAAAPRQRGNSLGGALLGRRYWKADQARSVERARSLLSQFGLPLSEDTYARELSGGQKRLLEIARGVMAQPRVLLLDEPFAGVNPSLIVSVEKQLVALRESGLTMVLVGHEMDVIERLCASVVVMARGKVLARGTMQELRENREVIDAYLVG